MPGKKTQKNTSKKKTAKARERLGHLVKVAIKSLDCGREGRNTDMQEVEVNRIAMETTHPIAQVGRGNEEEDCGKIFEEEDAAIREREREDGREEEQRNKRQRKSRDKNLDPFAIPPSGCDATTFGIQQPFVEVVFSEDFKPMEGDKVRDGKSMDRQALKAAITGISEEYVLATKSSRAAASELAHRDLHVALAKSFWRLTRPRRRQSLSVHDILALKQHRGEERVSRLEEPTELDVVSEEMDVHNPICSDQEDRPSNDSLDVRLEGDEGEGHEKAMKRVKYDIKFQVYDERIKGIDKTVVVLIVECKWGSLAIEDIYQVAAYACEVIKKNLQKGRFSPMHLEVWNETSWRYAVLYPAGLVVVEGQKAAQVKISESSKSSLTSLLEARKKNSKYRGFEYPDGDYLEGILYISNERYALPGTCLRGSLFVADSQLFYESKLRMVVGDKVLQWTVDDVKDALRVQEEALKAHHLMLLDD